MAIRHDGLRVEWFGYATVRLETPEGTVVYLDPGRYGVLTGEWTPPGGGNPRAFAHPRATDHRPRDADLVFVTHDHHYDPDGVERVAGEDATLVVYEGVDASRIDRSDEPTSPDTVASPEDLPVDVFRIGEEDRVTVAGVDCWTLPAYNEPDGPHTRENGDPYHPRGFGVGFLLSLAGVTVFWPGDSDALPGFRQVEASLFLATIGGTYAMDRHEATDLAAAIDPDLVLPVHYNTFAALETDSGAFVADVARRGVPVVLDES